MDSRRASHGASGYINEFPNVDRIFSNSLTLLLSGTGKTDTRITIAALNEMKNYCNTISITCGGQVYVHALFAPLLILL